MPRIPPDKLEHLKRDVSLERLATTHGVTLTRKGKDLHGKCPFHDDRTPSFVVDPAKNLWHCFGACAAGGDVIAFLQRIRGISFRHAVELLRADLPGLFDDPPHRALKRSTVPLLPCPLELDADDATLLAQVAAYYHQKLPDNPAALAYLQKRGLHTPELARHFQIGFADRSLGLTLPEKNRKDGAAIRSRLEALGILRAGTGHECYRGMITIPTFDADGRIAGLYGRRVTDNISRADRHRNLPGPLLGLLNREAFAASEEILLCEAPLDALTFWAAGYRNVTCAFGTAGFTDAHRQAMETHKIHRVLIAYDRDETGEAAAKKLADKLIAGGLEVYRILFPRGLDANDFARKVTPATKSLGIAIRKAAWVGTGPAPAREPGPAPEPRSPLPTNTPPASSDPAAPDSPSLAAVLRGTTDSPPAAKEEAPAASAPILEATPETGVDLKTAPERTAPAASPVPPAPRAQLPCTIDGDQVTLTRGDRRYIVRGLAKNTSFDLLRVNLTLRAPAGFHVDTLDLLQARQRVAFEKAAAAEIAVTNGVIHEDLGALLMALQDLQDDAIRKALEPKVTTPELTPQERDEAMELLTDPRLVNRIITDFRSAGVVGEELNTLTGYLATVSRKLDAPLAVILQSTSAAGKSTLMDAICDFVPPEDRVRYSAMTGQALFYMGQTDLAHKLLAIVEEEGAERASYALKILQSEGELTIASTGKDPGSGRHITHEYTVKGPVMIFLTTTAPDVDEELQNRALILSVNETREQTRAIQVAQRLARTPAGLLARKNKANILRRHQNAQRLLRPLAVAYPAAAQLAFPDDKTRTRRDHAKYLTLIDAIALLHQYQRPTKTYEANGRKLHYLQVTAEDIRLANRIAREVLGRSLDELPPQTRRLLDHIDALVSAACCELEVDRRDYRFTRKQVRDATGWGNTQLKLHMARLEDLEFLAIHRGGRGQSFVYELLYDGAGSEGAPFLPGLIDPDALQDSTATTPNWSGQNGNRSGQTGEKSPSSRPQVAPKSEGGRPEESPHPNKNGARSSAKTSKNASTPYHLKPLPYPQASDHSRGSNGSTPPAAGDTADTPLTIAAQPKAS